MMFVFIVELGFLMMTIIARYDSVQGPINPLSMEHQTEYLACTIRRILDFLQL
jgi:hypothetical protein